MVAYNFKKQFVKPIQDGEKRQTIRRVGKRKHAQRGDRIQLYTGQRTTSCERIIEDDVVCLCSKPVSIYVGKETSTVIVDGDAVTTSEGKEALALADGFDDFQAFHEFWKENHGLGRHDFVLIQWVTLEEWARSGN